jgi:hypothetical protein
MSGRRADERMDKESRFSGCISSKNFNHLQVRRSRPARRQQHQTHEPPRLLGSPTV